ncbi:TPA: hypothetical protein DEA21_03055 [Candidatus Uhrbacteria bacterium]|nr:hypothetical protein [Candidatus Uhrbacteria bacterium]
MNLKILTKKIETLEEKLARLECRINLSHSSLASTFRKSCSKSKAMTDYQIKRLNNAVSASAGILKNNKRLPKNPVVWQKQIRKEWN